MQRSHYLRQVGSSASERIAASQSDHRFGKPEPSDVAMTVRAIRRIAVLALQRMRVFRRRRVGDQHGSISLELLLATPVLMFTVTFVVWAGASGRAHLVSDLAAEEGAAVAASCMAAGESNIDQGGSKEQIKGQRLANEEQCNQMVSDMLEARPGLADLCIGGPSGSDGDNSGDDSPFLQTVNGDRFSLSDNDDDIDVLEVEHRCETDGAIGSLFGLYPSIAVRGHGSEIISVRGTPPPPNEGGNKWTCENRDPKDAELTVNYRDHPGEEHFNQVRQVVIMEPTRDVTLQFVIKDLDTLPCGSRFRVTTRSLNTFGCGSSGENCDFRRWNLSGEIKAGDYQRTFPVDLYNDDQEEGIEKFQILIAYVPYTEQNKDQLDVVDNWTPRNMTADLPNIVITVVIVDGDHEDYNTVADYVADARCDPTTDPDGPYFVQDKMTVMEGDHYVQILDKLEWLPCGTSYFTRAYSSEGVVQHETKGRLRSGADYGYNPELLGTPRPNELRDNRISGSDDGVVLIYDDDIYEENEKIEICLWLTPLALPIQYTRSAHKPADCMTLTIVDDQNPDDPCDVDYEGQTVFEDPSYTLNESGIADAVVVAGEFWKHGGTKAYLGMLPCGTKVEVSISEEDSSVTIISGSSSDLGNDDDKVIEFSSTNGDPPSPQFEVVSGGTMDPGINLYIRNNDDGLNANEPDKETVKILVDVIEVSTYSTLELGTRGILTITIKDDVDPPK